MQRNNEMTDVQFYKQGPGAVDIDGAYMEPGWYWVRQREAAYFPLPSIPYGTSTGPFKTKRDAERDFRKANSLSQ
jgi:hypothetical protein